MQIKLNLDRSNEEVTKTTKDKKIPDNFEVKNEETEMDFDNSLGKENKNKDSELDRDIQEVMSSSNINNNPDVEKITDEDFKYDSEIERAELEDKKKGKGKRLLKSNPKTNLDYYTQYLNRIHNAKVKRIIITIIASAFIISMVMSNVYFIFFREVKSPKEIAAETSSYIGYNRFNNAGLQKYLEDNFNSYIVENEFVKREEINDFTVQNIQISKIVTVSDTEATVFFTADFMTSNGTSRHSFLMPIKIKDDGGFEPTGNLTMNSNKDNSTIKVDDSYVDVWDFGNMKPLSEDDESVKSLNTWLNNFFTLLYNQKSDISSFYDGKAKIGDDNLTFNKIQEIDYYPDKNRAGFNVKATVEFTSSEGIKYINIVYLNVEKLNEGNFMLHSIR
jgi:hypothetical protein